ncbi:MAG: molybdopterin-guanine dinucleotide biosynthesis protein B [Candidatus Bathyarchaeia archaeon]
MLRVPVVAVVGVGRNVGKTVVAEALISGLVKLGLKVAAAKHIAESHFTFDPTGTDTRRFAESGASQVLAVTGAEVVNIFKTDVSALNLEALVEMLEPVDLLVLEGFKKLVMQRGDVAKIIVSKDVNDIFNLLAIVQGPVVAIAGGVASVDEAKLRETGVRLLRLPEGVAELVELVYDYYRAQHALVETVGSLGGLDCGDCGYKDCNTHAKAILAGRSSLGRCTALQDGRDVLVTVGGVRLSMNRFVKEIIRKTILGMMSSLRGVEIRGDEELEITIRRKFAESTQRD